MNTKEHVEPVVSACWPILESGLFDVGALIRTAVGQLAEEVDMLGASVSGEPSWTVSDGHLHGAVSVTANDAGSWPYGHLDGRADDLVDIPPGVYAAVYGAPVVPVAPVVRGPYRKRTPATVPVVPIDLTEVAA